MSTQWTQPLLKDLSVPRASDRDRGVMNGWHTEQLRSWKVHMKVHGSGFSRKVRRAGSTIPTSPSDNVQLELSGSCLRWGCKWQFTSDPTALIGPPDQPLSLIFDTFWSLKALKFALNFNLDLKWIWPIVK